LSPEVTTNKTLKNVGHVILGCDRLSAIGLTEFYIQLCF